MWITCFIKRNSHNTPCRRIPEPMAYCNLIRPQLWDLSCRLPRLVLLHSLEEWSHLRTIGLTGAVTSINYPTGRWRNPMNDCIPLPEPVHGSETQTEKLCELEVSPVPCPEAAVVLHPKRHHYVMEIPSEQSNSLARSDAPPPGPSHHLIPPGREENLEELKFQTHRTVERHLGERSYHTLRFVPLGTIHDYLCLWVEGQKIPVAMFEKLQKWRLLALWKKTLM